VATTSPPDDVRTVSPEDAVGDALVGAGDLGAGDVLGGDVAAVVGLGAGDAEVVTVAVGVAEAFVADGVCVALGVTMVEADGDGSSEAFASSFLTASWVIS
jgi:hypothetical protein